jgi:TonB family protein
MISPRKYSLISITIVISVILHFVFFIVIPSFGITASTGYTLKDISFLIEEFKQQKNGWDKKDAELKSSPITKMDDPVDEPNAKIKDISAPSIEPSSDKLGLSYFAGKKPGSGKSLAKTGLNPDDAREKLKEFERAYNTENALGRQNESGREMPYLERVRDQIQAKYFIPDEAKKQGMKGKVLLKIKVTKKGELVNIEIAKHSDFPLLDMAAIASVKAAAPFPDISGRIDLNCLSISIPFIYP